MRFTETDFRDIEFSRNPAGSSPLVHASFSAQSCGINTFVDQGILIMSMCLFVCNGEK